MAHGHGYVGITSKPVSVQSLKNFDYNRYCSLEFPGKEAVKMPAGSAFSTLPGTEEGLIWDMLGQTASALRADDTACFQGYKVSSLYLTGQSQSGAYLNTFISHFDPYVNPPGSRLFDGYMNIVGALVERSIRQEKTIGPLRLSLRNMNPVARPYICISSEADLYLFNLFLEGDLLSVRIENSDTKTDKCRYYEIPGAPHTDILCPVLTSLPELEKTAAKMPNLNEKLLVSINDFPTEFYICGLLEKLHIWAASGIAPKEVGIIERGRDGLKRDAWGNALGGLRSPFLEVPAGSYIASNPEDPEGISGKLNYFSKETFLSLYGTKENYLKKFEEYTLSQEAEGWIDHSDARKMISWSRQAADKILQSG